jgi:hypothetical protein
MARFRVIAEVIYDNVYCLLTDGPYRHTEPARIFKRIMDTYNVATTNTAAEIRLVIHPTLAVLEQLVSAVKTGICRLDRHA